MANYTILLATEDQPLNDQDRRWRGIKERDVANNDDDIPSWTYHWSHWQTEWNFLENIMVELILGNSNSTKAILSAKMKSLGLWT
jgi:hypothetical protein